MANEQTKHTPGPWTSTTDEHGRGRIYAGPLWIASTWKVTGEGNDSPALPAVENAVLIAAAPDLLAACKSAKDLVAYAVGGVSISEFTKANADRCINEAKKIMAQIDTAIALATGAHP